MTLENYTMYQITSFELITGKILFEDKNKLAQKEFMMRSSQCYCTKRFSNK